MSDNTNPGYVSNATLAARLSALVDKWNQYKNQLRDMLTKPTGTVDMEDGTGAIVALPTFPALQQIVNKLTDEATGAVAGSRASASSAAISAADALRSEDAARLSAESAKISQDAASASQASAAGSEANAALSESNAEVSNREAAACAANALTSESNARAAKNDAATSEANAAASATLAGYFSDAPVNVEVEPGRFSAFHWSEQARLYAPDLLAALAAKLDVISRYFPGQIVVTAAKNPPPRTLLCDGTAYSRVEYAALFSAIGTIYGAGDGSTTFNVPHLGEGTVVRATVDPTKVGSYDAGSLLSHTHGGTASSVADHTHSVSLNNGGGHTHGASADAQGDHTHYTWTDAQGNHAHSGSTGGRSADHTHTTANVFHVPGNQAQYTGGGGNYFGTTGVGTTGESNDHAHGFNTDWQGNHGHNIGMNGVGNHSHNIYIAAVGDHNHGVNQASAGGHTHTLTIAAAGGNSNLPAGTYMLHCIAY